MVPPTFRRARMISTGDFLNTSPWPSPDRGRRNVVSASFSLPMGQLAVGAAEMKRSRVGAVPEHRRSRLPSKWLAFQSLGTKVGLCVIKMCIFLVFGKISELTDDTMTVDDCRRVTYAWRTCLSRESHFLDLCQLTIVCLTFLSCFR